MPYSQSDMGGCSAWVFCNPTDPGCPGNYYALSGTVTDAVSGTVAASYSFAYKGWYTAWLPFTTTHAVGGGTTNPCVEFSSTSYYFHFLSPQTGAGIGDIASLFLPGYSCHVSPSTTNLPRFYSYPGASYPAALGSPLGTIIAGTTLTSTTAPGSCNPLTHAASYSGATLPITSATWNIPLWTPPGYGYTCNTPCPIPRENLTVSWTNTVSGNGSGTLVWSPTTLDWTLPCTGNLTVRLFNTGLTTGGPTQLTAETHSGAGCTGTISLMNGTADNPPNSYTCEPLILNFTVVGTSTAFYIAGYRTFTVTQ